MRTAKYIRLEAGLTGTHVAREIGATQPGYSAWENGRGTLALFRRKALLRLLRKHGYRKLTLGDLELEMTAIPERIKRTARRRRSR